mgnify:CR=1 FL=1
MKTFFLTTVLLSAIAMQLFAQKPDIQTINKITGTVGQVITISGNGFAGTTSQNVVFFGAAKAKVLSATNSTLEVEVPAGATFDQVSVTNTASGLTGFTSEKYLLSFNGSESINGDKLSEKLLINEEDGLFDLCACDFNGDNLNDIVTTNNRDENYSITAYINTTPENQSAIQFTRYDDNNFFLGEQTRNVACGDLDGDGKKDFIAGKGGNIADRLYLFRNISSGTAVKFDAVVSLTINIASTQASSRRIKIHDMDNDGKPEIIMTDQRNSFVHIYKNNSTPGQFNFSRDNRLLIRSDRITLGLDITDINKDGKPDIVFGSNLASDVYVAINRSNNGALNFDDAIRIPVQGQLINLTTGDFDLDGDQDIAVVNFVNNIYILLNQSSGNSVAFASPLLYETGLLPYGIDAGDINGDGKVDLVVATNEATAPLTILENKSTAGNLSFVQEEVGQLEFQRNVKIADFSGDGKPDISYTIDGINKVAFLRNQHCVDAFIRPEDPKPICAGNPSPLNATKALKVDYTWTNKSSNTTAIGSFEYGAATPGDYIVTIKSDVDACESESNEVTVVTGGSVLPPSPTVTGPDAVCQGSTLTLQSNIVSGVSYIWQAPDGNTYLGPTLQVNNASGEDAGKYSLVLEGDGCQTDPVYKSIDISIVPELEITATQGENFCEGTQNILSVANLENGTYKWYRNGQQVTGATDYKLTTGEEGSYYATFTNIYDCSSTSNTFTINKVAAPIASFDVNENACLNESVSFTNTSQVANGVEAVYLWDFGSDDISGEFQPTRTYNTPGIKPVSLTVSYGNQYCTDKSEKTITVAAIEGIAILVNDESATDSQVDLCEGDTMKLSVGETLSNIEWSNGSISHEIFVTDGGTYSVTAVAEGNSCNSSDAITVNTIDGVHVEILTERTKIKKDESIQLEATGAEEYEWTPVETLDYANVSNPIATPNVTTTYTVTGYNYLQCTGSASVEIFVEGDRTIEVDAQPVFTPNGDGVNDLWVIDNSEVFNGCNIVIMNRNGQTVYEAPNYNNDWDAKMNGTDLPEETYYYVIQCSTDEVHTGSITIMR